MNVFIHMHIYVHMNTCVYRCIFIHLCICIHMYICIYTYIIIHVYMNIHKFIYTQTFQNFHGCVCVCKCTSIESDGPTRTTSGTPFSRANFANRTWVFKHPQIMLQCVAVCCSVVVRCRAMQCVAAYWGVRYCVAVCCDTLQYFEVCYNICQGVAMCCSVVPCVTLCCGVFWRIVVQCKLCVPECNPTTQVCTIM